MTDPYLIKRNIVLSIDQLLYDYKIGRSGVQQAYDNAEKVYDYILETKKVREEDRGNLLMMVHDRYLTFLIRQFSFNRNYKIQDMYSGERQHYYQVIFKK